MNWISGITGLSRASSKVEAYVLKNLQMEGRYIYIPCLRAWCVVVINKLLFYAQLKNEKKNKKNSRGEDFWIGILFLQIYINQ